ncbi:hypothetical protein QYM36_007455 [Artemia franciscana]|uniref:Chitin-binding type-2 domain-containing protein n=1 Tax=Artemia franciscana TaxID=6661 RepID=A0AA88ICD7_ARTSF|nr:hypothetical protein QYM36_007455 [Artemia franciscana]
MSFGNYVACSVSVLLLIIPTCRSNVQCIFKESSRSLNIVDAISSEEVTACIDQYKANISSLHIFSSFLTELKPNSLTGATQLNKLNITAQNLHTIHPQAIDCNVITHIYGLYELHIKSSKLVALNEDQFKSCYQLRDVSFDGGELEFLSLDFIPEGSEYMRRLQIRNMPNLKTVSPLKANITGSYLIENTGIEKLHPYMFAKNWVATQYITFRNNPRLKVVPSHLLSGGYPNVDISFEGVPLEEFEPFFIDDTKDMVRIYLGGHNIRHINKTVFEPIFKNWKNNASFIEWSTWGAPDLICDCSINWFASDDTLKQYIQAAECEGVGPLDMVTADHFFHCFDCPSPDGLFSDPSECRYFYQCSAGRPYLKKCPDGLVFDASKQICEWPFNVQGECGTK